jgi:type VI secretion system protein ImpC
MPDSIVGSEMNFDFLFQSASGQQRSMAPLRIAILGDFGGKTTGLEYGPRPLDCDNFDEVFAQIGVKVDLPPWEVGACENRLRFRKLEDFHPDLLLNQLGPLANLTELRAKLLRPSSMEAAAKELQDIFKISALSIESPPATSTESTEEMLARLLGRSASEPYEATSPAGLANRLIQKIVGPNIPDVHPQQPQLVALADAALSARLRAILHHTAFQALESAWRGLDFLVRSITEEVKLYVINIRENELAAMLSGGDLAKSAIYKQLEKIRPAVVLGIYTFKPKDYAMLVGMARLANACQTAFVAGASPHLVGCSSFEEQPDPDDWAKESSDELEGFRALRRMPEAAHLGLAMPRFLLRQPYGKGSDAIEAFPFEELPAKPEHESYLWGNPAFLCGHLLAVDFASQGSDTGLRGAGGEVGGLPIHKFTIDGETQVKPCAEAWLSERAAEAILNHGIMPIQSVRGRDAVRLLALRALSNPPAPLAVRLEFEA